MPKTQKTPPSDDDTKVENPLEYFGDVYVGDCDPPIPSGIRDYIKVITSEFLHYNECVLPEYYLMMQLNKEEQQYVFEHLTHNSQERFTVHFPDFQPTPSPIPEPDHTTNRNNYPDTDEESAWLEDLGRYSKMLNLPSQNKHSMPPKTITTKKSSSKTKH